MNHIVLIHPAIPQNTGNIMRSCVCTNSRLHLIEPLGFSIDDKHMKRAGLDYVKDIHYKIYPDFESFLASNSGNFHFFTRYSKKIYSDADFCMNGDHYLFFGHEHDGIPKDILTKYIDNCLRIPMFLDSRSLNLSNSVAIGLFEALRQQGFPKLSKVEVQKGEDFLYRK